jgi:hypothetical protein
MIEQLPSHPAAPEDEDDSLDGFSLELPLLASSIRSRQLLGSAST